MGIVLGTVVNQDVIDEFQKCHLYPHDTSQIIKLFNEFKSQRMNATDNKQFGLRINSHQLSEWRHCDTNNAAKLISRWKSVIAVKSCSTTQLLNNVPSIRKMKKLPPKQRRRRNNVLRRQLSSPKSISQSDDISIDSSFNGGTFINDKEISILPIFCAMILISSGKVSDKLKSIIHLFVNNKHDSVSRNDLDIIIENTISAIAVLLDLKHFIPKLRRNAQRHIYQKNCNSSTTFNKISRGSLAVWLLTSPYIVHIFCLHNTSDSQQRYKFIQKFYDTQKDPQILSISSSIAISLPSKQKSQSPLNKRLFRHASVPNLAAINDALKGTNLDFTKDQSVYLTMNSLSKSYSASQLKRTLIGNETDPFSKRKPKFQRVDSKITVSSTKSMGNKSDGPQQYYGGAVPFDAAPVGMEEILGNFEKHYKLSMKVQNRIRAPPLVNKSNVKSMIDGFNTLSNGKEFIKKEDIMLNDAKFVENGVVSKTLDRIFRKCDITNSRTIDQREFLMSQFGSANDEELDRAMAFNQPLPRVNGWIIQFLKKLFDKLTKWRGWGSKVRMSDFYALCMHCLETRQYVIKTTRLKRSKMKQMVTFREACIIIFKASCKFDEGSERFELLLTWVLKLQPGLNREQKVQLKYLYDTMEQRKDGTISIDQLENATEWILPNVYNATLLPYLFHKFEKNEPKRINCNDFLYFMEWIWFVFQNEFRKRKINRMMKKTKFGRKYTFRPTLSMTMMNDSLNPLTQNRSLPAIFAKLPKTRRTKTFGANKIKTLNDLSASSRFSMTKSTKSSTPKSTSSGKITSSSSTLRLGTQETALFTRKQAKEHKKLLKYAQEIKDMIENAGDYIGDELKKIKDTNYGKRYWSNALRKRTPNSAWIRMVFLAIRLVDIQRKQSRDESAFGYINVLENTQSLK